MPIAILEISTGSNSYEELSAMYLHYVYAYLRQSDNTPYYIGKGKGRRAYYGKHSVSIPNDKSKIVILEANLSNIGACAIERRLIRWYGRKDLGTGILHNKTDGGEGQSGAVFSEEHRSKMKEAWKTRPAMTEDTKKKLSVSNSKPKTKGRKLPRPYVPVVSRKPYYEITCPHCNKLGGSNVMRRFHFDKCKTLTIS